MSKEMRALLQSFIRPHVWAGILLPACTLACSNGLVELKLLSAADTGSDAGSDTPAKVEAGASGNGGSGGRGGGPDLPVDRGAAGSSGSRPPAITLCDATWEPDQEEALRQAFNQALSSGRFCPRESVGLQRALVVDTELQFTAHAAICYGPPGGRGVWGKLPRSTTMGWVLSGTASLEEAEKALLDGDHKALCDDAQSTNYRNLGVGHGQDYWSVIISPGLPDAMRRDDMQKP